MATLRETKPYDQRLARVLITPFRHTVLHPNHLTTMTLILGQSAAVMFAIDIHLAWCAALLYMLAVFSDHMDGELARMTGKTSSFGHKYDYIVGGINYTSLFIGIGIGLHDRMGDWAPVLGFAAGLSNPFILYLRMRLERQFGQEAVEHPARAGFEIEDFVYLIGPITWLAGILWFFVPYALGNIGYLFWTIREYRRHANM
ncbi:MAG: CDP-alcohol phosphatidyltransferase family protein [Gammaproteobacteria bacterium]